MEISFNPSIRKNSPVDFFIKSQLEKLGLQPTGSQEGDIKAIQNALTQKSSSDENQISGQMGGALPPPQTPEAVANFMEKLGLEPTNSKEGDNALITAKLSELESNATTPLDTNNVQSLKAEFESIIAQAGSAGQQQTAAMNKSFFNLQS
ncbi:MAG TPA: hypothetical protein DDW90_07215 [Cyanobacteria bacterium UBA9971]|nr:hypothetical protein [Cyanobacteria bacterium UBA9971]